jgi:hypothetical protein
MVTRSGISAWWQVALGAALWSMLPAQAQQAPGRVPAAHGTTLAGNAVALPDALKGKVGVLVVGFSKASQTEVAGWGRRLAADYEQSAGVVYFEAPMLAGAPKMLRGMIVHQMKSTVPEAERPHFLPLMEDEARWRAVAHYAKADDAYVLLVDGEGNVRWQTEGDVTDAAYGNLKQALDGLSPGRVAR